MSVDSIIEADVAWAITDYSQTVTYRGQPISCFVETAVIQPNLMEAGDMPKQAVIVHVPKTSLGSAPEAREILIYDGKEYRVEDISTPPDKTLYVLSCVQLTG